MRCCFCKTRGPSFEKERVENESERLKMENIITRMKDLVSGWEGGIENIHLFNKHLRGCYVLGIVLGGGDLFVSRRDEEP